MKLTCDALLISALISVLVIPSSGKRKDKDGTKSNATPLIAAASNCNLDAVNALLKQGADFKAHDEQGRDALTFASLQRTKHLDLQCPEVVLALTKVGADPASARFYQSPELTAHPPRRSRCSESRTFGNQKERSP